VAKACECASDEMGYLSEAQFDAAFAASCDVMRIYCVDDVPVLPQYPSFYAGWEATHVYQDPAATPVALADGTADFVTEGEGTNVSVDVTNSGCWPIELFGVAEMVVNWSQTAGCSMTWYMKIHRDGVFLTQASFGQVAGNNTDPGEVEAFTLAYPLGQISPGDTWTFEIRPQYSATATTAFDTVTQVSAALRIFGGDVTS
jgi:hypothetical protein